MTKINKLVENGEKVYLHWQYKTYMKTPEDLCKISGKNESRIIKWEAVTKAYNYSKDVGSLQLIYKYIYLVKFYVL